MNQGRQQNETDVVGRGDSKYAIEARRVEAFRRAHKDFQGFERLLQRLGQLERTCGRRHATAHRYKQRIMEQIA
ncbi:hypothetical protein D9M73_294130 [compost metagenome]